MSWCLGSHRQVRRVGRRRGRRGPRAARCSTPAPTEQRATQAVALTHLRSITNDYRLSERGGNSPADLRTVLRRSRPTFALAGPSKPTLPTPHGALPRPGAASTRADKADLLGSDRVVTNIDWPSRPGLPGSSRPSSSPTTTWRSLRATPLWSRSAAPTPSSRRRWAVVEVPHRRPRRPPGTTRWPSRSPRPTTQPRVPRVVQPLPDHHEPHDRRRRPRGHAPGEVTRVDDRLRRQALLQPGASRGARVLPGRDHGRGHEVRHRRRSLRRLLLPVPGGRPGLPRRGAVCAVRCRTVPCRLAAEQHRPADHWAGLRDQGGQAVGQVRRLAVRRLDEQQREPLGFGHQSRRADIQGPVCRHPPMGAGGVDRLHLSPDLLGGEPGGGRLQQARRLVVARGRRPRRCTSTSGRRPTRSGRPYSRPSGTPCPRR